MEARMSLRRSRIIWLVPFGLCVATGALARQAVTPAMPPPQPTMSIADMTAQAGEYMGKIRQTESRITVLQDHAKKKRDMVKLNCVNDKLTQVRGHVTVANQSMTSLKAAIAANDDGGRQHEFTRVTIIHQKVMVLGTEAENCIGDEASYVGATKVDVEIDPNIPDEDPTQPQLPLPDVTRPPAASPFV
jgi:hypothetical protein